MDERFKFLEAQPIPGGVRVVRMRCPHCRHNGTFTTVGVNDVGNGPTIHWYTGIRRCPNPDCLGMIFVLDRMNGGERITFPPEIIDFDATNLPSAVLESLEEAVRCLSVQCYRAAAVMVRRTLEAVCEDRGATGDSLIKRLKVLGSKVVVPEELLEALDALRLLGNDAVHLELKDFDDVGHEEVVLALDVAKELLKSVYQYSDLIGRLQARRKTET